MTSKKIRGIIKKRHPHIVRKVKRHLRFKYPKLLIFIISIILAYLIFRQPTISNYIINLKDIIYLGPFIAGILLSFGFTAPFGLGYFIISNPNNIFLAALLGAIGCLLADMAIFKLIKVSFMDEFNEIKRTKTARKIEKLVDQNIKVKIRHYLLYIFAGITLATPVPDEIGVSMFAGLTTIKPKILATISFILHYIEILIILSLF